MKLILLSLVTLLFTSTFALAEEEISPEAVTKAISEFGFQAKEEIMNGVDNNGHKCKIALHNKDSDLSVEGASFLSKEKEVRARFSSYLMDKVTKLKAEGSAANNGVLEIIKRSYEKAHKNYIGIMVMGRYVDESIRLEFANGKLIEATVVKSHSKILEFLLELDPRTNRIEKCRVE